jgi:hypothetical protein
VSEPDADEGEYEVEGVLDEAMVEGQTFYLLKWKVRGRGGRAGFGGG